MNRFWDELISHGAEVVGIESYGTKQTDFGDAIKKLVGLYYPRPEEPAEEAVLDEEVWDRFLEPQEEETGWLDIRGVPEAADDTAFDQDERPQEDQGLLILTRFSFRTVLKRWGSSHPSYCFMM